jgi:hypothetical protein
LILLGVWQEDVVEVVDPARANQVAPESDQSAGHAHCAGAGGGGSGGGRGVEIDDVTAQRKSPASDVCADGPVSSAGSKHVLESYGWKSDHDPGVPKRRRGDYLTQRNCVICKMKTNWYCTSAGCRHMKRGAVLSAFGVLHSESGSLLARVQRAEAAEAMLMGR